MAGRTRRWSKSPVAIALATGRPSPIYLSNIKDVMFRLAVARPRPETDRAGPVVTLAAYGIPHVSTRAISSTAPGYGK